MIRNSTFGCESLGISYFWIKFPDSRHVQLAIYTVFHEESESAVRIDQFLHPEKTKKNQPTRVSISYRKISYHTSPAYNNLGKTMENLRKTKDSLSGPCLSFFCRPGHDGEAADQRAWADRRRIDTNQRSRSLRRAQSSPFGSASAPASASGSALASSLSLSSSYSSSSSLSSPFVALVATLAIRAVCPVLAVYASLAVLASRSDFRGHQQVRFPRTPAGPISEET